VTATDPNETSDSPVIRAFSAAQTGVARIAWPASAIMTRLGKDPHFMVNGMGKIG
jgi:hypothetical protein